MTGDPERDNRSLPYRNRRERTEEWASIKQRTLWHAQELYEQIRPLVLFHETAGERAKEIDVPKRTLYRKADEFERTGCEPVPLLGEYRVHTALLRMGIEVSPATCGRIMAANHQLYGLSPPQRAGRAKLEMPFKYTRRHEYRSIDVRYIEEHLLEDPRPVYVITVFENFSPHDLVLQDFPDAEPMGLPLGPGGRPAALRYPRSHRDRWRRRLLQHPSPAAL